MQFLKDSKGQTSSMRVINFLTTAVILVVWGAVCYQNKTIVDIPPTVLGLFGGSQGLKVIQKWVEENSDKVAFAKQLIKKATEKK